MADGKKAQPVTAADLLPFTVIAAVILINLFAIDGIRKCMALIRAWEFAGTDWLVGPLLLVLRLARITGLVLLVFRQKLGFHMFVGSIAVELVFYIIAFLLDPPLLYLAQQLMDVTTFEMIVSIALMFVGAPIILWNLIADRWESLK